MITHAIVITSSPYKNELAKKQKTDTENNKVKCVKYKSKDAQTYVEDVITVTSAVSRKKAKQTQDKTKASKRQHKKQKSAVRITKTKTTNVEDDADSLYYGQLYLKSTEGWIKHKECGKWADTVYAEVDANTIEFVCELCSSDYCFSSLISSTYWLFCHFL